LTSERRWLAAPVAALLILAAVEGLARTPAVREALPPPSYGGARDDLDVKLARIEAYARGGPIPCIALGSSMAAQGFDPAAFSAGYARQTGEPLRCFNFGLNAYTTSGVAPVAAMLVRRYHPSLLIFLTTPRDFSAAFDRLYPGMDSPTPWLQYQSGEVSAQGWLIEHSAATRYALLLGDRLRARGAESARARGWFDALTRADGYRPVTDVRRVDQPPNRAADAVSFALLWDYALDPADLDGLRRILSLNGEGVQVVVAELPVSEASMAFFARGEADYATFLDAVRGEAAAAGVPFWEQPAYPLIPPDGWDEYLHLNAAGAEAFSEWLGQRMGRAVIRGEIGGESSD
jgi:hypothetical protein